VEEQPAGKAEHLSISVLPTKPDCFPSQTAVEHICMEFGWPPLDFENLPVGYHIWMETSVGAINLLRFVHAPDLMAGDDHGPA